MAVLQGVAAGRDSRSGRPAPGGRANDRLGRGAAKLPLAVAAKPEFRAGPEGQQLAGCRLWVTRLVRTLHATLLTFEVS